MGCNLSKEQINEWHICMSKGGLTANVKLHFFTSSVLDYLRIGLFIISYSWMDWAEFPFFISTEKI